jgi:hypothetical protein
MIKFCILLLHWYKFVVVVVFVMLVIMAGVGGVAVGGDNVDLCVQ